MFDSESYQARLHFRAALAITALFIVSLVQSCNELQYSMWGVEATGQIATVEPSIHDERDWRISFFVTDTTGDRVRVKRTVAGKLGPFVPDQQIDVIYFEGRVEEARLVSERSFVWPIVFFVMLGAVVVWIVVVVWQYERG